MNPARPQLGFILFYGYMLLSDHQHKGSGRSKNGLPSFIDIRFLIFLSNLFLCVQKPK